MSAGSEMPRRTISEARMIESLIGHVMSLDFLFRPCFTELPLSESAPAWAGLFWLAFPLKPRFSGPRVVRHFVTLAPSFVRVPALPGTARVRSPGHAVILFFRDATKGRPMTRADLSEQVCQATGMTRKESDVVVCAIFDSIVRALRSGDKAEIRGFGSFHTRQRRGRNGKNPRTGARVEVPPKKIPFFKPSRELRELVNSLDVHP
jgi:integration host factor subunit beta